MDLRRQRLDLGAGTGGGIEGECRHLDGLLVVGNHALGEEHIGVVEVARHLAGRRRR